MTPRGKIIMKKVTYFSTNKYQVFNQYRHYSNCDKLELIFFNCKFSKVQPANRGFLWLNKNKSKISDIPSDYT